MTTAYHPQADRQSKRTDRTIEATLRIMVLQSGRHWVDLLPAIELTQNFCLNLTTGKSTFKLVYGCSPANFGNLASCSTLRYPACAEKGAASLTNRRIDTEDVMARAQ